jgi:hypothetical protein
MVPMQTVIAVTLNGKPRHFRVCLALYQSDALGMSLWDIDSDLPYGVISVNSGLWLRGALRLDSHYRPILAALELAGTVALIGSPDHPYPLYELLLTEKDVYHADTAQHS